MFFCPLTETVQSVKSLREEYKGAKRVGIIRLGQNVFFFSRGLKIYYVTYAQIQRCFRRVMLISSAKGSHNMKLELVVIASEKGELAQLQTQGAEAAKSLMEELKVKLPHADFTCPDKKEEDIK